MINGEYKEKVLLAFPVEYEDIEYIIINNIMYINTSFKEQNVKLMAIYLE